ncbi:MAG: hypothetical protein HYR85_23840 [Planctomycetes bacterium]|nr:hypothetical protein [Planctomycetota bacterium]MBI3847207.1 hypothetical protein [Planctomycetota bacterium]
MIGNRIAEVISRIALAALAAVGGSCATPAHHSSPDPKQPPATKAAKPDDAHASDRPVTDAAPIDRAPVDGTASPVDELMQAGDRSAADGKYTEALESWRQALLVRIPTERDLPFLHPVPAEFLTRPALREKLLAEMEKEHDVEDARREEIALKRFGLIPADCDWVEAQTSVLEEQIAGFYDPDTKRLYLICEDPNAPKKHGFLSSLFGSAPSFDADEQKVSLAHEMDHALDDQHFDLFSIDKSVKDDDDVERAIAGLVEGDATMLMLLDSEGRGRRSFLSMPPEKLAALTSAIASFTSAFGGGKAMSDAPLLLKESLVFPYFRGWSFIGSLTQNQKWDKVDAAFRDLPTSTEQILHPEKYAATTRDEAIALSFDGAAPLPESDWELVTENCLGEFQIEILLRPAMTAPESRVAASGWGGDRYRVYRRKESDPAETLLVWATTWDTEEDAIEFANALMRARAPRNWTALGGESEWHKWSTGTTNSGLVRRGSDVFFIDGVADDAFDAIAKWCVVVTRGPKHVHVTKATPSEPFPAR